MADIDNEFSVSKWQRSSWLGTFCLGPHGLKMVAIPPAFMYEFFTEYQVREQKALFQMFHIDSFAFNLCGLKMCHFRMDPLTAQVKT